MTETEIPGTILLIDVNNEFISQTAHNDILLEPTPTSSPRDPLNWPIKKKYYQLFLSCTMALMIGYSESVMGAPWTIISEERHISMVNMNGGSVALRIGRKFVYVFCLAAAAPISYWSGSFHGITQWYLNNLLLGCTNSIYEALIQLTVFYMFFAHEYGTMLALAIIAQILGNFLGSLLGGIIAEKLGWPYGPYIFCAFSGGLAIIFLFTFDDTMYHRLSTRRPRGEDLSTRQADKYDGHQDLPSAGEKEPNFGPIATTISEDYGEMYDTKRTYLQVLSPIHYIKEDHTSFWTYLRRPFTLFLFPNIVLAGLMFAFAQSSLIVYFNTMAEILESPPYNFSTITTGLVNIATLVGAILGLVTGHSSDLLVLRLARQNKGYREPEQRLWAVIVSLIYTCVGYMMYGWGAQTGAPWIVIAIGLCFLVSQQAATATIATAYTMECFDKVSGEIVVVLACLSSVINFAISFTTQNLIDAMNYGVAFTIYGCLVVGSLLMAPLLMIYSKS
ncbi:hypothetical protein UA08_09265 [Talaromyces atroroseus]|uniref:Major facilitator superfamily (MFS) profile domain-containing protein n=1 Tax=Talaromyces atroroseus TaxID=1441469 RepID=A0A1Q5Q6G9_TALAT|nr:hypothetical protein UA08_09265 [Talaromyces atroroseus]OKL55448.1 hypothetical protein UA08_09265 [Talaromyces atroroseus]